MERLNQLEKHQERQRAIQSCDRCKKRKRACKRYNEKGEQVYDKSTPCSKCLMMGLPCETSGVRKKRKFFCVSESSMIQLNCLTKIFKAIFPECDPENPKDRENIAKLLCVKLPGNIEIDGGDDSNDSNDNDHPDGDNIGSDYEVENDRPVEKNEHNEQNLAKSTDKEGSSDSNTTENNRVSMKFKVGQDSSDKLFEALIEVQKRRSSIDASGLVTSNVKQDSILYQVWILGRRSYFLNEKNVDASKFVSNAVIKSYIDAVDVCLYNSFFSTDLATVKMLYLTGLYHATISNRNASWHLITSTCLKCVGLGFNRNCVIKKFTEDEQEEIRLVWWACFRYHMNGCIILGKLPNISLYDVDVDLPKMDHCKDKTYKDAFLASVDLFKLMFPILKNREYLNESKDPWSDKNINNMLEVRSRLFDWKDNLPVSARDYQNDRGERHIIKLHLLYHHCIMSLLVPYLIAYALKPNDRNAKSSIVIDSLALCIHSAIELVKVVKVSSGSENFNNLLSYDLFYAYNSLMVLLLGLRLVRIGSEDPNTKDFNVLKHTLKTTYGIDYLVLISTINDIKEVNETKGDDAKTVMMDASKNIKLLLKHFNFDKVKETLTTDAHQEFLSTDWLNFRPTIQPKYPIHQQFNNNDTLQHNLPVSSFQSIAHSNYDQDTLIPISSTNMPLMETMLGEIPFNNSVNKDTMNDVDFFNVLDNINMAGESQAISLGINDKLFWDWNKLFNDES
ncbi:hypothetical protein CANINC_000123 [Pichia inconspicua]|uniref:Zn(2)-C6 fungal-type domain-containing protein n=1 Tax=Pichia inconspicua TaxID=52247 RepID=A0A4T0X8N1_9ASCO|nr:hypothetical protein CANINC_000123 [[Candida] inconspicua]